MPQENPNIIEKEIEILSQQIEERRRLLSQEQGLVSDKELIRESIDSTFKEGSVDEELVSGAPPSEKGSPAISKKGHYLDNLPNDIVLKINDLVDKIPTSGLRGTISKARKSLNPVELDAFHDLLIDRLYDELKEIGAI